MKYYLNLKIYIIYVIITDLMVVNNVNIGPRISHTKTNDNDKFVNILATITKLLARLTLRG